MKKKAKPKAVKKPARPVKSKAKKARAAKKPVKKAAKPKVRAKPRPRKPVKPVRGRVVKRSRPEAPPKPKAAKPAAPPRPAEPVEPAPAVRDAGGDVYFNGRFVGETPSIEDFVKGIRNKRRAGIISSQLNVTAYPEFSEARVNTDSGRARRPLIIVERGRSKLTPEHVKKLSSGAMKWSDLVRHGVIEYLDADEEENSLVALGPEELTPEHTHMEINPITMLGVSASLIPYPEYNRGDRINYGAKMVGQAIGVPAMNFMVRTDTKFNTLNYPQIPIVNTITNSTVNRYPDGQNVIVAIMCWDGYNLNDAIVMNRSSIERGLFRSFYYRTYETVKKRYWGGQEDEIGIPEPGTKGYRGEDAYTDLADDGVINLETRVVSDSVLIGKTSPLRFLSGEEFTADIENKRDTSVCVRYGEEGVVDSVLVSETPDGNQLIKVRVRDERIPEIGDKFASRHGQKGVVSLIVPQEDMPFTSDGVVPDVIFNPHGIPSRMTIGQLLEILAGKSGALAGEVADATAFNHRREEDIRKLMKSMGFRDDGKQVMYDGRSGRMYEVMIFVGASYFMKLDHMVANKIHARARGPVTLLTKQPTEGRAKRGGLRLGEMEQQCLVGHGAAMVLKERFSSDRISIPVCTKCGLVAIYDRVKNRMYCGVCKDSVIDWVETAYAFKLTVDELKSMGIYPKIALGEV